jgi:hypothetical protein
LGFGTLAFAGSAGFAFAALRLCVSQLPGRTNPFLTQSRQGAKEATRRGRRVSMNL